MKSMTLELENFFKIIPKRSFLNGQLENYHSRVSVFKKINFLEPNKFYIDIYCLLVFVFIMLSKLCLLEELLISGILLLVKRRVELVLEQKVKDSWIKIKFKSIVPPLHPWGIQNTFYYKHWSIIPYKNINSFTCTLGTFQIWICYECSKLEVGEYSSKCHQTMTSYNKIYQ